MTIVAVPDRQGGLLRAAGRPLVPPGEGRAPARSPARDRRNPRRL